MLRVLGYVWLATLGAWVGGTIDADGMATDLATAAHLLLDDEDLAHDEEREHLLAEDRRRSPGSDESIGPTISHSAPASTYGRSCSATRSGPPDDHRGRRVAPVALGCCVGLGPADEHEPAPGRGEQRGARANRSTSPCTSAISRANVSALGAPPVPTVGALGRDESDVARRRPPTQIG